MNDTHVMQTDLDTLAERIEKAAGIIQQLRSERERFERERDELLKRLRGLEEQFKGQNPGTMVEEIQALRKEQREWQTERRDVAARIESLVRKLDRIEA
jgi:predicted  nucleic acid-binding Zn-ribbon protein